MKHVRNHKIILLIVPGNERNLFTKVYNSHVVNVMHIDINPYSKAYLQLIVQYMSNS